MKTRLIFKSTVWLASLLMLITSSFVGNLSTGTAQETSSPTALTHAISGDSGYSPTLKTDGTYSWGDNRIGQLGDGTTHNWQSPSMLLPDAVIPMSAHVSTSPPPIAPLSRILMGGSIQGTDLGLTSLNARVTTFAGSGVRGSADGTGTAASFDYLIGITTDGTNLYVTEHGGHRIRRIVIATGAVTTLAGSGAAGTADGIGTAARFHAPHGITTDGTNLFVSDHWNNRIRRIVIATGAVTTIAGSTMGFADGAGTAARFNLPSGITTDGTNLFVSDQRNDRIRRIVIATGAVTTLAGSGARGSADGTGTEASFNRPQGITTDGTYLYVADSGNNRIRRIVIATGAVTTLAGSGAVGPADGTGTAASFNRPYCITTDGINLYVVDTSNHRIRRIVIATGVVTTITGSTAGFADGTGTAARFNVPHAITTDGTSLYVVDWINHRIRKISPVGVTPPVVAPPVAPAPVRLMGGSIQGTDLGLTSLNARVTTFAGSGAIGSADGTDIAASFNNPWDITTDGTNLYVVDNWNHRIRRIEIATGVVTTLAGSGWQGFADGTGTAASFNWPAGITTDGINLYVADAGNHRIRRIVIATGVVTTLAGSGARGSADGTGTAASFNYPLGITTDGTNLYVADTWNHRIRRIVIATGVVTTLAGSTEGFADGTGTAASFSGPLGITTDGTNLYVGDSNNHRIRRIVIATGVVTTIAGSVAGFADGTGTAASFNRPLGITTDGTNLYVADANNNRIRKISPVAATLTVTLPNGGENWPVGSTQNITWSTAGVTGNVHIQISRDGGATWTDIFANTANDGSEPWTVTGPATTTARIRITSIVTPTISDISNANFTISVVTAVVAPIEQVFRIFPNPVTNVLNIEWKGIGRAEIEIISSTGLVVLRKTIDSQSNQVDIGHLPEGIYILRLRSDNFAGHATFIKQGW